TRGLVRGWGESDHSGLFRRVRARWKRRLACKLPHEDHQFCAIISETRPRERIAWAEAALAANRRIGNRPGEGSALNDLGQTGKAIECYEQVLVIGRPSTRRNALGRCGPQSPPFWC